MADTQVNIILKKGDSGPAVEDVQSKLHKLGYLKDSSVDSFFGDETASAISKFCKDKGIDVVDCLTETVWARLVDDSFSLGDRNLFLRMPYFHGNDVLELQKALGSLGFQVNSYDGIFGTATERALRRFQINMGLPSDGIAGSQTFMTFKNLQFTWSDKTPLSGDDARVSNNVWRASEVLENNSICLFGTDDFTRDVALRMSNLARATNPFSKVLSSNAYSIAPDKDTMLLHIVLPEENDVAQEIYPRVLYIEKTEKNNTQAGDDEVLEKTSMHSADDKDPEVQKAFVKRLTTAIGAAKKLSPARLSIELPGKIWWDAGEDRSAQHFAIALIDALCMALDNFKKIEK